MARNSQTPSRPSRPASERRRSESPLGSYLGDVAKVDVDSDPALALAYGDEIPVLCMGARRIVSGRVSARALRAMLARHAPS